MTHRFLFAILLLFLLPGCASAFSGALKLFLTSFAGLLSFGIGAILGVILDLALIRRVSILNNFFHEWGHAFTALLFFQRIDRFVVTRYRGGEVYHSGGFGGELVDDVIGLAPYTIPVFYFISVLARPLIDRPYILFFDLLVGFTFGLHAISSMKGSLAQLDWSHFCRRLVGGGEENRHCRQRICLFLYLYRYRKPRYSWLPAICSGYGISWNPFLGQRGLGYYKKCNDSNQ